VAAVQVGDWVLFERIPESVREDDPEDDVFRECIGRKLLVVAIEANGDLELDVRPHGKKFWSIFVPPDCVQPERVARSTPMEPVWKINGNPVRDRNSLP